MLELVDCTVTGKLVAKVDGKLFLLRRWERGKWRADMVDINQFGRYTPCDDDDWIIRDGKILWREVGWDLRKEKYERPDFY